MADLSFGPVRKGIAAKLTGALTLDAATVPVHDFAPAGTNVPFVSIGTATLARDNTQDGTHDRIQVQVRSFVNREKGTVSLHSLMEQITTLLDEATLTLDAGTFRACYLRSGTQQMVRDEGGGEYLSGTLTVEVWADYV